MTEAPGPSGAGAAAGAALGGLARATCMDGGLLRAPTEGTAETRHLEPPPRGRKRLGIEHFP